MKNLGEKISKLVAKVYNIVPGDLKIVIYPAFLAMVIAYLSLFVGDLQEILASAQEYEVPVIIFSIVSIGGLIGYLQKKIATKGESVLVKEGDKKAIQKLTDKVDAAEKVLKKAP